jgi:uncharacterized cupin superfamily protein
MNEARMDKTEYGRVAVSDGWFIVNVRDAAWMRNEYFGQACVIEGDVSFPQVGYTIHVLRPGQPNGLYHREDDQEDFLVLAGECIALVEGEERRLKTWDFMHCPAGTEHIFVGAGDEPCVIFMAGARQHRGSAVYPPSEVARRHGAAVDSEATPPDKPYEPFPKWQPGPPASFDGLPFA